MAAISSSTAIPSIGSPMPLSNKRLADSSEEAEGVAKKQKTEQPKEQALLTTIDSVKRAIDSLGSIDPEVSQHLLSASAALEKHQEVMQLWRLKKAKTCATIAIDVLEEIDAAATQCFRSALDALKTAMDKVEKKPALEVSRSQVTVVEDKKTEERERVNNVTLAVTSRINEEELHKEAEKFQETAFLKTLLNGNKCYVIQCTIGTTKFSVLFKNDSPTQISHEIFTDTFALEKSRSHFTDCTHNASEANDKLAELILETSRNNQTRLQPDSELCHADEYLKQELDTGFKLLFPKIYVLYYKKFDLEKNNKKFISSVLSQREIISTPSEKIFCATSEERDGYIQSARFKSFTNYDLLSEEIINFTNRARIKKAKSDDGSWGRIVQVNDSSCYLLISMKSAFGERRFIRVCTHANTAIDLGETFHLINLPRQDSTSTPQINTPPPQSQQPSSILPFLSMISPFNPSSQSYNPVAITTPEGFAQLPPSSKPVARPKGHQQNRKF